MNKLTASALAFTLSAALVIPANGQGLLDKLKQKAKDKTEQRIDEKMDKAVDKALDGTEKAATSTGKKNENEAREKPSSGIEKDSIEPSLKVYQNYDFVPGDKILFEDNFDSDPDGEFPSHWELVKGQATLNKMNAVPAFYLIEGNYVTVKPRMNAEKYLADPFTIEFDYYHVPGAYGIRTHLQFNNIECDCESSAGVSINENEVTFDGGGLSFTKSLSEEVAREHFDNRWHHVAIASKNHQLKVYVDQARVLVVPTLKMIFTM